jgi:hypothetical protein
VCIGLAYRFFVALRPLPRLDGVAIPDDTYLSLTIARNIAKGLGPWYGLGYTNGFQPLWVFLLSPLHALLPSDPDGVLRVALLVLAVCDAATAYLLCTFVRRRGRSELAPVLVAGCWAFNPYFVRVTLGGLESSLAMLAVCATLVQLDEVLHAGTESPRPLIRLGVLLGVAFLARVDAILLVPALALFLVPRPLRSREALCVLARRWGIVGLSSLTIVAPWLLYSVYFTGDIFPVSGRAVRLVAIGNRNVSPDGLWAWKRSLLSEAWRFTLQSHALLLVVFALILTATLAVAGTRLREFARSMSPLLPATLYALLLFLAYPLFILAWWFFYRYYLPIGAVLLLAIGFAGAFLLSQERLRTPGPVLVALLVVGVAAFHLSRYETWRLLFSSDETSQGYRNLGIWAAGRFPAGTRIGSSQTGALGYFAPALTVVNLDGVVNKACYESLAARRNINYILDQRIAYVVGWRVNIEFIRRFSDRPIDDVLEPLGKIEGFESLGDAWYLYRVRLVAARDESRGADTETPRR